MKRYWDYSESERAKLTAEQVEKLLGYELMEQGVLQIEPLKLEEVPKVALPTRRVFTLYEVASYGNPTSLGIACETVEQAEAAKAALRFVHESPWNGTAHMRDVRGLRIIAEDVPTEEAVSVARVALEEQKRLEQANSAAKRAHEEACKKVADATSGIWSDWRGCQEAEYQRQKIRDTLVEYRRMTDGDETVARAFLAKVFPADEIEEAVGPQPPEAMPLAPCDGLRAC